MAIEPDTKDWTWVLERPCPQCGFDASDYPSESIAGKHRLDLPRWRKALGRADVRDRPDEGTWSMLEYAAHVRDVYVLFRERTELMLAQEDPIFEDWDQDRTAREKNYAAEDPGRVAGELAAAGEAYAALLESVREWDRVGRRSNGSRFTVETLAQYGLHDVVHHLSDVRA
ncbi:DinB family protein [Arthrobacter sp. EH-1B-1]|uniref:DinB family protein n=1 Tax=Arthrobacter vasquezii TaxID=2977629 RepID=A0ABT6CS25_9MICC|nr:DinB family protein [Arthrobacter vasquezii]MDF9276718.1 DinB family protein [Arthrobacter vasquezii]